MRFTLHITRVIQSILVSLGEVTNYYQNINPINSCIVLKPLGMYTNIQARDKRHVE